MAQTFRGRVKFESWAEQREIETIFGQFRFDTTYWALIKNTSFVHAMKLIAWA